MSTDANETVEKKSIEKSTSSKDVQINSRELSTDQIDKLKELISKIPKILEGVKDKEYDEIFGHRINTDEKEYVNVPVRNEILLKFLVANEFDVETTQKKLVETLNWRSKFKPLSAAFEEEFDDELTALGFIAEFKENNANLKVSTWNLYGNISSPKELFEKFGGEKEKGKVGSQFLRWRIGLMEQSLSLVDFTDPENNKIAQIHDYKNVSMFRMDPNMKAETKNIVSIFGDNYPELLSIKFFLNVPTIMSWIFTFFKKLNIISAETLSKFQVLNSGDVSAWFGGPKNLPKEYNGGVSNDNVASIADLYKSVEENIKVSEYGAVILKKESATETLKDPVVNQEKIPSETKEDEKPTESQEVPQASE